MLMIYTYLLAEKRAWKEISARGAPSHRFGHTAAISPTHDSMFIFGGYDKSTAFYEVYQYHFGTASHRKMNAA